VALAFALLAHAIAWGGQVEPSCAPDKALQVSFDARESGRAVPLVATHEVVVVARWQEAVRDSALSVPGGVLVLETQPRQLRLVVPAGESLAVTASWAQAADPSDPDSDVSDPATRCVASQTVALPVTPAKPPRVRYDIAGRDPSGASIEVVPDRRAGDMSPLEVSVRVVGAARFPSPGSRARRMSVAMRPSERVRYRRRIPSPALLGLRPYDRFYNLTRGLSRLFTQVITLSGAPLPPAQPRRDVAPSGVRINAFTFTPNPAREPRTYEYGIGYDIQVRQSGRLIARARRAARCGKLFPLRYYCNPVRRRNG
jgi:hypothetical protein